MAEAEKVLLYVVVGVEIIPAPRFAPPKKHPALEEVGRILVVEDLDAPPVFKDKEADGPLMIVRTVVRVGGKVERVGDDVKPSKELGRALALINLGVSGERELRSAVETVRDEAAGHAAELHPDDAVLRFRMTEIGKRYTR